MKQLTILVFLCVSAFTLNLDFSLIKKGDDSNNTMLLIGGIQGDEPGGFLAASLVATDYNITKGSLWIVPNLNYTSIIQRSRGTQGDMNRKFDYISPNDVDFKAVSEIKKLIDSPKVSLILNLHDGSGFFRQQFIDQNKNPKRWGNTCIIDQSELSGSAYPNLFAVASSVKNAINQNLLHKEHKYHIKNTNTANGDMEMAKSLTFYAIKRGKSAFANEASKNLNAHQRTYYHLIAIEEYMKIAGIEFSRNFKLSENGVKNAIEKEILVSFYDDFFKIGLKNPRANLNFFPLQKNEISYKASNPITAVIKDGKGFKVQYGNRFVTKLNPQYFEYGTPLNDIQITIDDKKQTIKSGDKIFVKDFFKIDKQNGIRANIIGFNKSGDEAGEKVSKNMVLKNFSIDKNGKIFRIEFYQIGEKNDKFVGMVLVEFV